MEKREHESRAFTHQSGKTGSILRDFRFRVPSAKPSNPVQYGIVKRISERVLATTSENICDTDPSDDHLNPSSILGFPPTMESLPRKDEDDQFVDMKTLCIDKRTVNMPSNDEHEFLKFCGLGLKSWQCPIEYNQAEFRSAILNVYPRLSSVIGFTIWTLTENMKILERIPDEKTCPKQLLEFQQVHCTDILIIVPSANVFLMEEKREYLRQIDSHKSGPAKKIDRYFCLVCGTKESPGYTSDFYRIKTDQIPQWTKKQTIEEKLEEILGLNFKREPILSDKMCPKCFKYISWIDKMEEQLKRSRGLLSNAFHATNSKLNRLHVTPKAEKAEKAEIAPPSVFAKSASFLDEANKLNYLKTDEAARPVSPDLIESHPVTQNDDHVPNGDHISSASPSISLKSSSLMPSLTFMSTYGSYTHNYTSGYESSCSQSDLNTKSPEPPIQSAIYDHQADSCFESDSNYRPNESPKLYRRWESSLVDDLDGDERDENALALGIKRKKSPDFFWEVINSQDLRTKNQGPLKKRNLSHSLPADPPNLERVSKPTKGSIANTGV
eukprot:GFUD01001238.1.p1 GENE.GFUD01001238.1~~GFUD01001238.1.p1  ORF type:complete len:554 (+),score=52.66 GFUD01001238.1:407-2068(+)